MTTGDAWREIAKRLSDPDYWFVNGLCDEVGDLYLDGCIICSQYDSMLRQINRHIPVERVYAYPPGTCRAERILACLFFACEADDV